MHQRPNSTAARRLIVAACCAGLLLAPLPIAAPARAQEAGGGVRIAELSSQAEQTISGILARFAKTQNDDGSWAGGHKGATTAMVLMAFMLRGEFPKRGPYGGVLDRAVGFLVAKVKAGSGYFGGNMYEHALGTLALSEVWGMSDRAGVGDALKSAVDVILRAQAPSGGWRYTPYPNDADISVTVMQIVALHSAKEAGIYVPERTIRRAMSYVKSCQNPFGGGFGYTGPGAGNLARTGAGVTSLLMCGASPKSREVRGGLGFLFRCDSSVFLNTGSYFYGHYYAVQATYQAGENYYQRWYPKIHDGLLKRRKPNGTFGSTLDSAFAVLILGVPYRFLPVYQR